MGSIVPFLGMVMAVLAQASDMVISKAAMSKGISRHVLLVYSYALSSLILLPISIFSHRSDLHPLCFPLLSSFFLLALIGFSGQALNYAGVQFSSPTLGTAMLNLVPAFTFIFALLFRMEKLDLKSSSSLAKFIGTVVSISGAFTVTIYKGLPFIIMPSFDGLNHQLLLSEEGNWILGGFLSATHAMMTSLWYILQASILKKYTSVLIVVFFYSLFATILSAVVSLTVEDFGAWRLRTDMGLVAVIYSPLGIVAAALMGIIFLGDTLFLGSVIGAIVIAAGFYAVMWGIAKEEQAGKGSGVTVIEDSSTQNEPLLQTNIHEINKLAV
ncbi:WAT1-related protein At5g40240-like isoform X2 [Jatropha curcas]|uniref:WAT1-related protein At5g40240-like isoform X2 n=1 Tax=Jatropha curcas TaxID=180498 RepID=UPI00189503C6|nr:WAT1-related protein At5g40240-like isoform X2 [Jatropha curcas]